MKRFIPVVATVAIFATVTPVQNSTAAAKVEAKEKAPKVNKCKRSRKFKENQVHFGKRAIRAGRCLTDRYGGIKAVWSRPGHHPTGGRALDIMVNTHGSCKAGRPVGFNVAKHLMKYSKKYGVMYIIWDNKYWSASTKKRPAKNWRHMGRGGCTHGHYDHVHVSFK